MFITKAQNDGPIKYVNLSNWQQWMAWIVALNRFNADGTDEIKQNKQKNWKEISVNVLVGLKESWTSGRDLMVWSQ